MSDRRDAFGRPATRDADPQGAPVPSQPVAARPDRNGTAAGRSHGDLVTPSRAFPPWLKWVFAVDAVIVAGVLVVVLAR